MSVIQVDRPGKVVVGTSSDVIKFINITAGIGFFLYDNTNKIGAGCHIVLQPLIRRHIVDMATIIKEKSGKKGQFSAKIAGGAEFLSKTLAARKLAPHVVNTCKQLGIRITGHDLGGNEKRTITASLATGETKVCTSTGEKNI